MHTAPDSNLKELVEALAVCLTKKGMSGRPNTVIKAQAIYLMLAERGHASVVRIYVGL